MSGVNVVQSASRVALTVVCAEGGSERTQLAVEGAPLVVECELRAEQPAEWRLSERTPPSDMRKSSEVMRPGGGVTARLTAAAAHKHHVGVYTCELAPDAPRVRVLLQSAGTPRLRA